MKLRVIYEQDDDGCWIADIPEIQGCHTFGKTLTEARGRVREAIECATGDHELAISAELIEILVQKRINEDGEIQTDYYSVSTNDAGEILLRPIAAQQAWVHDNPEIVASIQLGVKQAESGAPGRVFIPSEWEVD